MDGTYTFNEFINITIVSVDDYEACYIDGICKAQNHSLSVNEVLKALSDYSNSNSFFMNVNYESHYISEDTNDLEEWGNQFPEKLEELNKYIKN